MLKREKSVALSAVRDACRLTRRVQAEIAASGEKVLKADRSPVTVADLAAQVVMTLRLRDTFPGARLMAEEDASALSGPGGAGLSARVREVAGEQVPHLGTGEVAEVLAMGKDSGGRSGRFWLMDPVDGTKGFLRGEQYAVALALVENGEVVLGLVGCPNLPCQPGSVAGLIGCIFVAEEGSGATQVPIDEGESVPLSVDSIVHAEEGTFCESVESAHTSHGVTARVATRLGIIAPPYRVDGQTKYGIVARGQASIYLRLPSRADYREKIWDHAAGSLIVEEAGGRVSHVDGRELDFSTGRTLTNASGIVVTNGSLHSAVLAAMRAEID